MVIAIIVVENPFALIARVEFPLSAKGILAYNAIILASLADGLSCTELTTFKQGRQLFSVNVNVLLKINGMKCTAVGTHQLRFVAAYHTLSCQKLKGTYHRVVAHSSSLYYNSLSEVIIALELQHLVQTVLDDRIGESCANVCRQWRQTIRQCLIRLPFAHHLFNL